MIKEQVLDELLSERYRQLQMKIAKEAVEESKHFDNVPLSKLFIALWIDYVMSN